MIRKGLQEKANISCPISYPSHNCVIVLEMDTNLLYNEKIYTQKYFKHSLLQKQF